MLKLVRPKPEDRPLFDRLAQLYAYDFSEMTDLVIDANGLFPAHHCFSDICTDSDRHPFLIFTGTETAGFAIVHWTGDEFDMEQFFVLRKFRRRGIGRDAAQKLFRAFSGKWSIEQITANPKAQIFWRNVIADYTNGDFSDSAGDDPVQSFIS